MRESVQGGNKSRYGISNEVAESKGEENVQ
jgi:hypothetical protein